MKTGERELQNLKFLYKNKSSKTNEASSVKIEKEKRNKIESHYTLDPVVVIS